MVSVSSPDIGGIITLYPPGNDSPSCVDSKTVQNDTVGNAPPVGGVKVVMMMMTIMVVVSMTTDLYI